MGEGEGDGMVPPCLNGTGDGARDEQSECGEGEGEGEDGGGALGGEEVEGPEACERDADCGAGQACVWRVDPDVDGGLLLVCGPPVGGGAGGVGCAEDDFCRSGRCLVEAATGCFRACVPGGDDGDCGELQDCVEVETPLEVGGGERVTVGTCVDDPGSLEICENSAGCPSDDELCIPSRDGELACRRVRAAGGAEGGPCEVDEDCRNGLCLDGRFCFAACGDADDCPAEAAVCEEVSLRLGGAADDEAFDVRMCHPPAVVCRTDVDCTPQEACRPSPHPDRPGEVRLICAGRVGEGLSGAECAADGECRSGLCLEGDVDNPSVCWGPCAQDGDCEGNTMCYSPLVWFDVADRRRDPNGPPQWDSVSGCSPDLGSYRPCAHNPDCPAFEVCMPLPDRHRRGWDGVCMNARGNPFGQPGAGCFNDEGCASGICLGQLPNTLCFGLCEVDADCGDRNCVTRDIPVDDRGTPNVPGDDIAAPMSHCFL